MTVAMIMTVAVSIIATWFVHSTIALGIAAFVSAIPGRHDAWRERAWKLALVVPLLSAPAPIVLGGVLGSKSIEVDSALLLSRVDLNGSVSGAAAPVGMNNDDVAPASVGAVADAAADVDGAPGSEWTSSGQPVSAETPHALTWPAVIAAMRIVVVALVAVGVTRLVVAWIALRGALRRREVLVRGPAARALRRVARRAGITQVPRLTESAWLTTPIAFGVRARSAEICLPEGAQHRLDAQALEGVVAHELAHHVRRDPAWYAAVDALTRVLVMQPLLHLARREVRRVAEYRSDAWAARVVGDPAVLARSLTEVAGWLVGVGGSRRTVGLVPGMSVRPSALRRRVTRLLDGYETETTPRVAGTTMLICGALALSMLVGLAPAIRLSEPAADPNDHETSITRPPALGIPAGSMDPLDPTGDALAAELSGLRADIAKLVAAVDELPEGAADQLITDIDALRTRADALGESDSTHTHTSSDRRIP